jgi:hypothetical protein
MAKPYLKVSRKSKAQAQKILKQKGKELPLRQEFQRKGKGPLMFFKNILRRFLIGQKDMVYF